jgi:mannosyltransferase
MVTTAIPPSSTARAETSAAPTSATHPRRMLGPALAGLITCAALVLRWHALGAKSVWVDEGISIAIARLRWPQFFQVLWQREANMALYYALLHLWIRAGSSETFVRALSVLFSVATVALLYALGARLFGRATGLLAAWLLAINAYHVRYAQEARSYGLVIFLAVLATWLLVRNVERPAEARWGLYSVVAALTVYAQFFGALMIAAHGVSLLVLARRRVIPWRDYARSLRWTTLMILPITAVILRIGNTSAAWIGSPSWQYLYDFSELMAGNRGAALVILDALALAVAALAAWRDWRRGEQGLRSWRYALVFAWLLVPLGIVLAVSVVRPIFLSRYLIFCLPALLLGVAAGIARLRPAPLAWAMCAALSILSLQGTLSYYRGDFDLSRDDWRSATAYILDHTQPGDGIFFATFGRMPYEYYKSQRPSLATAPEVLNWPGGAALEPQDFAVRPVAEMLRDARPAQDRVWLVLFLDRSDSGAVNPTSAMLRAWYGKGRRLITEQDFPQITVYLFARDAASDRPSAALK